ARMSRPDRCALYQSAVQLTVSRIESFGAHPKASLAKSDDKVSVAASGRGLPGASSQLEPAPSAWLTTSATCATVNQCPESGPKFNAPGISAGLLTSCSASTRYPERGSRTCCQGRTAFGYRRATFWPFDTALTTSGTRRSSDQSPPPMTLPARTVATA